MNEYRALMYEPQGWSAGGARKDCRDFMVYGEASSVEAFVLEKRVMFPGVQIIQVSLLDPVTTDGATMWILVWVDGS